MKQIEATQAHVEILMRLQSIETESARLEKKLGGVEAQTEVQCKRLNELEEELEIAEATLASEKKRYATIEEELAELNLRITKSTENLRVISNAKEYQVLKREVDDNTKRVSEMEDVLVSMIEELEGLEKGVADVSRQRDDEKEKIDSIVQEIRNATTEERDALSAMVKEKEEISGQVPKALFEHYEKLLTTTNRLAVVKVSAGVCYGCFMNIPPQLYIEIQKSGGLHHCPQCHRILFCDA
ncbi:MAG: C4-type zinc ribbon domain-containing protein [Desulfobacterales bacterium]|nr:C4-type zinc ribbon domain-containing protein [Desulfobacterales bacterium]